MIPVARKVWQERSRSADERRHKSTKRKQSREDDQHRPGYSFSSTLVPFAETSTEGETYEGEGRCGDRDEDQQRQHGYRIARKRDAYARESRLIDNDVINKPTPRVASNSLSGTLQRATDHQDSYEGEEREPGVCADFAQHLAGTGAEPVPEHLHSYFGAGKGQTESKARIPPQLRDTNASRDGENVQSHGQCNREGLGQDDQLN